MYNFADKNGENERDLFPPLKLGSYFLSLVFRFSTETSHSTLMWKQSQKLFSDLNKKLKSGSGSVWWRSPLLTLVSRAAYN